MCVKWESTNIIGLEIPVLILDFGNFIDSKEKTNQHVDINLLCMQFDTYERKTINKQN